MKKLFLTAMLATQLVGCASTFSDMRPNGDGSYTVTQTRQGIIRVMGQVYRCGPVAPNQMDCTRVDRL